MEKKTLFICLTCYGLNYIKSPFYIKGKNNGIGNILFQLSSALYYAYKNDAELYVPSLNTYFESENIKKEYTIFKKINTNIIDGYDENKIISSRNNKEFIFDYKFYDKMILSNYFENYNNFNEYRNVILDYFRPTQEEKEYLFNKYKIINNNNLSSIHIRKGPDYDIIFSKNQIDNMEKNTFQMIDYMIENKNISNFFILTNDKNYCLNIFNNNDKYKKYNFFYSEERDFYDIWLISLIQNNIVSRSTLAWWGSYLNENQDKFILSHSNIGGVFNPEWVYI